MNYTSSAGRVGVFGLVVAGLAILLIALASVVAPTLSLGAPASTTLYTNSAYGYELTLPDGWRHSDLLSNAGTPDRHPVASDIFTARSTADEAAGYQHGETFLPPAWQWAVQVEVWDNPKALSPMAWASDPNLAGWAKGQTVSSVTLGGQPAARQVGGAHHAVSYYVAAGAYMFRIGYFVGSSTSRPTLATDANLNSTITSFRVK